MRKNIDIDSVTLTKLKVLSAFEDLSVKKLMEKAISNYVEQKEMERMASLSQEEKEDLGLLLLMQSASDELVSREEVMNVLNS
ncbi:hypothetical protein SAMN06298216_2364 [Spirosomataceae bacterium TFI 002]|nr:hypothetical protein SAMN06298216_2364 [Spirosomataceae bacterium TFI 002]